MYEDQFKASAIGLMSAEEYKQKKQIMERMQREEVEELHRERRKLRQKKERERKRKLAALSFDVEDEEAMEGGRLNSNHRDRKRKRKSERRSRSRSEAAGGSGGEKEEEEAGAQGGGSSGEDRRRKKELGKDPLVETSFLPDRARAQEEAQLRRKLEEEWRAEQERIKKELLEITWSYWDGTGHRFTTKVEKGTRIDQFLEACRRQVAGSFPELRGVSAANLMYVKEDLIIPHHYTFYDLIVTKARGKSGPLFHFGVHEDVRLAQDVRIEKDESHAGKVITRAYYERNKHIFPINRFEVYDPEKDYGAYTIR